MGKRNVQLASRLAEIVLRLNNGETLQLKSLADEYGVHQRTIRRDIEDRLAALQLQRDETSNGYRIPPEMLGRFDANSIELFSLLAGIKGLFPPLDKTMLSAIFSPTGEYNFLVHGHKYVADEQQNENFPRLQRAIDEHRKTEFRYLRQGKNKKYAVEPYKLVNYHGIWYLAALHEEKIKHFSLSKISALNCTFATFTPNTALLNNIQQQDSVWASEEKFEVVLKVSAQVAEYFLRRQLLNEQIIEKQLADGELIISTLVSHNKEILPVVQYWIPHIKIIAPESLQKELEQGIKAWLAE